MANEKMVRLDEALEAVHAALSGLDLVEGPNLSDADVVAEAIKKYRHSLSDMGLDIDDVADEDYIAENIDLDKVMGNHSCGELTEALCEYHGTSDVLDEVRSSMGRTGWRETIIGEAVHELGYSDQIVLVNSLFQQEGFDGHIEETLRGYGWEKAEAKNLALSIDRLMEHHGRASVLSTVLLHPAVGVEDVRDATQDLSVQWREELIEGLRGHLALPAKEEERAAPADKGKVIDPREEALHATETITGEYLIEALCNNAGGKTVVGMVKGWGAQNGIDPFADIRAEIEAEVKKKFAERLMACLFGA